MFCGYFARTKGAHRHWVRLLRCTLWGQGALCTCESAARTVVLVRLRRGIPHSAGHRHALTMSSWQAAKTYVLYASLFVLSFSMMTWFREPKLTAFFRERTETGASAVLALCTAPETATAESIAQALLSAHLVACVNVVPGVQSMYWWEGKIHNDKESLLIMKTRSELQDAVIDTIRKVHPYQVPEVLFLPIQGGLPAYLDWLHEMTRKSS